LAENEKPKEKKAKDVEAIERVILIAAPPEIVFDFLIKPELVARWIGRSLAREPKAGDRFLVEFSDSGYVARGVYTEVSPPRRIAFTWGWEGHESFPPGASLVEIELVPHNGGTQLRLRHSGLPKAAPDELSPDGHSRRWQHYLARLQSLASADRSPTG